MLGHDPPTYRRSTTAMRFPCEASVQARSLPGAPLPRTTTSYSSGCDMFSSFEHSCGDDLPISSSTASIVDHDHLPPGLVRLHDAVRFLDVLEAEHARRLRLYRPASTSAAIA